MHHIVAIKRIRLCYIATFLHVITRRNLPSPSVVIIWVIYFMVPYRGENVRIGISRRPGRYKEASDGFLGPCPLHRHKRSLLVLEAYTACLYKRCLIETWFQ